MAEEIIAPVEEQTSPPIESVEPPAPVEKSEPSEPKKLSTRDTIKASIKEVREKEDRTRTPEGKFAKEAKPREPKEPKAAPVEAAAPVSAEPIVPEVKIEAPKAWPKEKHAIWNGLPQEAKDFLLTREEQVSKGFAEYQNLGPVKQTVEKHTPYFQQMGVHPSQYLENAISWDRAFRDPQTRDRAIHEFAATYGINLSTAPASSEPQEIPLQLQPIVQQFPQITQEINQLRNQVSGFQNERLSSEIQAFAKNHPHFEKVRVTMGQLMQSGAATDLETAYQKAIRLDDNLYQENLSTELEKKTKEAVERAKSAHKAAVSIPPRAPVGANGSVKGTGVRGSIISAIEEVREKQRA